MKSNQFSAFAFVTLLTVAATALAAGGNPLSFGKPDFELTGRVYDDETKEPIEGAYVVALYYEGYSSLAAVGKRCKRAKGMYTSKDGKFHFPVEKLDGLSPGQVMAIKTGYFSLWPIMPPTDVWKKQGKEAYTGHDLPLKRQDPTNPSWQLGHSDIYCLTADAREDVEAAVEFLEISLGEERRMGFTQQRISGTAKMIRSLQELPARKSVK